PYDPRKSFPEDPTARHITDAGMRHLEGMTKLRSVVLVHTWITSEGLAVLRDKAQLISLNVRDNRIDDLTPLGRMTGLRSLYIPKSSVTSVGPILPLRQLNQLGLYGTPIDDAGLAGIED